MERVWTSAVQIPAMWGHAREVQAVWLRAFSFILSILHLNSYLWLVATLLNSTGIEYGYPQYFYWKKTSIINPLVIETVSHVCYFKIALFKWEGLDFTFFSVTRAQKENISPT